MFYFFVWNLSGYDLILLFIDFIFVILEFSVFIFVLIVFWVFWILIGKEISCVWFYWYFWWLIDFRLNVN